MTQPLSTIDVARRAAQVGGDLLTHYFRTELRVDTKQGAELVSKADVEAEQAIAAVIIEQFPEHTILGEELHSANVTAEHLWIIDPLDGTTNFLHGIPHFAVSVAYYEAGRPVCGVVYNPARDDWFEATAGGGATHNGASIHVSPATSLSDSLVGVGFYYDRGAMMEATLAAIRDVFRQQVHGIRRFGTASLDLCQVACGYYGAFFEYQLSPWDFAAGRLIVEEAGGRVTTCGGEPPPLTKTSVLASNARLHQPVLDIVQSHHPR